MAPFLLRVQCLVVLIDHSRAIQPPEAETDWQKPVFSK